MKEDTPLNTPCFKPRATLSLSEDREYFFLEESGRWTKENTDRSLRPKIYSSKVESHTAPLSPEDRRKIINQTLMNVNESLIQHLPPQLQIDKAGQTISIALLKECLNSYKKSQPNYAKKASGKTKIEKTYDHLNEEIKALEHHMITHITLL